MLVLLAFLPLAFALTGYECDVEAPKATKVSLRDIKECKLGSVDPDVEKTYFQLLQRVEHRHTRVIGCKIIETLHITRCGMFSHASEVNQGHTTKVRGVTSELCRDIIELGQFAYSEIKVTGLATNTTSYRTLTLVGSLSDSGSCDGGHFSVEGHEYKDVVVQAQLEITAFEYNGLVNLDTQVLTAASMGCEYGIGKCQTTDGMHLFWNVIPKSPCFFDRYAILYEGPGAKVSDNSTTPKRHIFFTNHTGGVQFGLARGAELNLCGYVLWSTEHPSFFILEGMQGRSFASDRSLDAQDVLQEAYFNTKITYLARHIKTQFDALYKDVLYHQCNLQRQVLANALQEVHTRPDVFAMMVMDQPGYMAYPAGEVAYVFPCKPVDCKLRETTLCYDELPVICEDREGFLKDRTAVIVRTGTHRLCHSRMPVTYKLGNSWHSFNPEPADASEPHQLDPTNKPTWKYTTLDNLMNGGIYTSQNLKAFREQVLLAIEHQAHLQVITRRMNNPDYIVNSDKLQNLIDKTTLQSAVDGILARAWGKFTQFGLICAGFLGIYVIVMLVKWVADTLVRGYTLHSLYGCGAEVFAAVLGSVTHCLLMTEQRRRQPNQYHGGNARDAESPNNHRGGEVNIEMQRTAEHRHPRPIDAPGRSRSIEELEQLVEEYVRVDQSRADRRDQPVL